MVHDDWDTIKDYWSTNEYIILKSWSSVL